jgi:hypothetical protein
LTVLSSTAPAVVDATHFLVAAFGTHHSLFDLASGRATRSSASKSLLEDGVKEELRGRLQVYFGSLQVCRTHPSETKTKTAKFSEAAREPLRKKLIETETKTIVETGIKTSIKRPL